jgi:hypothetical protein
VVHTRFNSRAGIELGALYLFNHLRRFGFMMHIGVGPTFSNTEKMYSTPPTRPALILKTPTAPPSVS